MGKQTTEPMEKGNTAHIKLDIEQGKLPVGIGIEIPGGRTYSIIEPGTRLPLKRTETFSNTESGQMAAEFVVLLGNRPLAQDNLELCRIRVRNVRYGGAGTARINITFELNRNGKLTISTRNLDRKEKRDVALTGVTVEHVTNEQIAGLLAAAEEHKEHDAMLHQAISDMLDGYQLLSDVYEEYAFAKKSMSFSERHAYRKARKRLRNALNVLPPETTEDTLAELKAAHADLKNFMTTLAEHRQRVEGWWAKKA